MRARLVRQIMRGEPPGPEGIPLMSLVHWVATQSWLSHPLIAVAILTGVVLMLRRVCGFAHWIGAALAVGFYWGREKRDHEARLRLPAAESWNQGILPWEWTRKSLIDFFAPALTVLFIALAIELWRRHLARRDRPGRPSAREAAVPTDQETSSISKAPSPHAVLRTMAVDTARTPDL